MAKPNYAFAKRQRDLAKKQIKEEKAARRKAGAGEAPVAETGTDADAPVQPNADERTPA